MRGRIALVMALAGAAVALGAWCGWVSGFRRASGAAEITWLLSTAGVLCVDVALWRRIWRLPPAPAPWPRAGRGGGRRALGGVAPWLALIVAALAWDALGIDTGPHQYHLTISALAQAYRPLNAALLLVWLLVGVGYEAARVRAPVATAMETAPAGTGAGATDRPGPPERGTTFGAGAMIGTSGLAAHAGSAAAPALLLPSSPPVGVAFGVAVPVVAVAIDVVARRSGGTLATAEEFVRFVSTARWVNVLLIVAWLFAGYHLYAR